MGDCGVGGGVGVCCWGGVCDGVEKKSKICLKCFSLDKKKINKFM